VCAGGFLPPAFPVFRSRCCSGVRADRPTILVTEGYGAKYAYRPDYREELSQLLDANIVFVEHRYFLGSTPDPRDWRYLTAEASACDLHDVRQLLGAIYPGKWIATGISKGGTTTMLYATFFPGDVDGYVPYVARSTARARTDGTRSSCAAWERPTNAPPSSVSRRRCCAAATG